MDSQNIALRNTKERVVCNLCHISLDFPLNADLEDGTDYVGEGGEDAGPGGVTVVLY